MNADSKQAAFGQDIIDQVEGWTTKFDLTKL